MKERIAIVTDTNSGISVEEAARLGVYLVAMPVILNGETFFENVTITQEEFFTRLKQGMDVGTSQPAPGQLMDLWDQLLEEYEELVYFPMSSGLSGGYQTAAMLAEEYDGRVYVVNNRRISVTLRQSVLEAKYMADQGVSADQIAKRLTDDGLNSDIFVAVNTLELLKKSGRVTAAGAAVATILSIKPILRIQGSKLDAWRKARGMKNAMQEMINGLKQDREDGFTGSNIVIRAAYSGSRTDGEIWQETLQQAFPDLKIGMDPLPLSIACHVGDGALGVGIMNNIIPE